MDYGINKLPQRCTWICPTRTLIVTAVEPNWHFWSLVAIWWLGTWASSVKLFILMGSLCLHSFADSSFKTVQPKPNIGARVLGLWAPACGLCFKAARTPVSNQWCIHSFRKHLLGVDFGGRERRVEGGSDNQAAYEMKQTLFKSSLCPLSFITLPVT